MFLFLFCVQGIYDDVRIGVYDYGAVAVVAHHTGFSAGDPLDFAHRIYIIRDILAAGSFRLVGGKLGRLGNSIIRGCSAAAGNNYMTAVNLLGVEPQIVLPGKAERQFFILLIVPAYINGIPVGRFKPQRR